jgi:LDH2 family malate/lactate/ureidoglycolate dehydrogenase
MKESSICISADSLSRFILAVSHAMGLSPRAARLMADSLVSANLRGVDSHGVHLLPHYVAQLKAGNISVKAEGRRVWESGGCLHFDGQNGIGQIIASRCCAEAVRLAYEHGLGMVVARNSNHFGAAAFWGQRLSNSGMIGIVMCNASPTVPPWQGKQGRVGTNPLCISVPSSGEGAWLLDMSTTTVALNKILRVVAEGESQLPTGWALDAEGVPTRDPATALKGLLMPLGGYKGSGLGMLVEILCGVLSGGAISSDVGGLYILDRPMRVSQMFLAIDVTRFMPLERFQSRMESLIRKVKSAAPAQGYDEVLVAGDPERRSQEQRRTEGIPIGSKLWGRLRELADELGIERPRADGEEEQSPGQLS